MPACPPPIYPLCLALVLSACSGSSDGPAPRPLADPDASMPPPGEPATPAPDKEPEPEPEPPADDNPFQVADPTGDTVLERRGYRDVAERADQLVSTDYLDVYRESVEAIRLLAEDIRLGVSPVTVACPSGGSALLSRPEADAAGEGSLLRFDFASCELDSMVMSGELDQRLTQVGARFDQDRQLDSRFNGLTLDLDDGTRLVLDGNAQDDLRETTVPICGSVPAVVLETDVALASVTIISPVDGTTRLQDVSYNAQDESVFENREACDRERRISFTGAASVALVSEPGGAVTVTLSKSGTLLRDDDDAPPTGGSATLTAIASDDSSLGITATDDAGGLAQFDLRAGSAVVSFVDSYTFEP